MAIKDSTILNNLREFNINELKQYLAENDVKVRI